MHNELARPHDRNSRAIRYTVPVPKLHRDLAQADFALSKGRISFPVALSIRGAGADPLLIIAG
jgi:hypothetical protein